jgi:hypothetical protein
VFLSLTAVLLVLLATRNPREALVGSIVVLAGVPVYGAFRRKIA